MHFSTSFLLAAFFATAAIASDDVSHVPRSSLLSRTIGAGVCNGEACCDHGLPCNRIIPGGNCCEGLSCCGSFLNPVCKYPGDDCGSTS